MSTKPVVSVRLDYQTLAVLKLISEVTHDAPEAEGADTVSELARNILTRFADHYMAQFGDDTDRLLERLDSAIEKRREEAAAELEEVRELIVSGVGDEHDQKPVTPAKARKRSKVPAGVPS